MLEKIRKLLNSVTSKKSFFDIVGRYYPYGSPDYHLIEEAYDTAKSAFRGQERESGERYFEHLRAVAVIIMVYLRVRDSNIIAAALLHDIVEDIDEWTDERLALKFNRTVSQHVWWVTKPPAEKFHGDMEARNRAYHQNLARAPRPAMFIKLADRLHNVLTLWDTSAEKQRRKVTETQDFYLPLAEMQTLLIHELEAAINELRASWKDRQ